MCRNLLHSGVVDSRIKNDVHVVCFEVMKPGLSETRDQTVVRYFLINRAWTVHMYLTLARARYRTNVVSTVRSSVVEYEHEQRCLVNLRRARFSNTELRDPKKLPNNNSLV